MTRRILLSPRAELDLAGYHLRLSLDSLDAADRFFEKARATFEFLARSPLAGKRFEPIYVDLVGLRIWRVSGFPKYLVFYAFTARTVDIRRVVHGAMDIEAELSRE